MRTNLTILFLSLFTCITLTACAESDAATSAALLSTWHFADYKAVDGFNATCPNPPVDLDCKVIGPLADATSDGADPERRLILAFTCGNEFGECVCQAYDPGRSVSRW